MVRASGRSRCSGCLQMIAGIQRGGVSGFSFSPRFFHLDIVSRHWLGTLNLPRYRTIFGASAKQQARPLRVVSLVCRHIPPCVLFSVFSFAGIYFFPTARRSSALHIFLFSICCFNLFFEYLRDKRDFLRFLDLMIRIVILL